jgi:hypothetical protein
MLLFDRPAGASVGEVEPDALAAGKAITSEAVKQAGGDASVLLTLGYMGPEEKVLEGATQVLPKAPVVGGTSSDHSAEGKFQQFGKGKTNKGSFAIAAIGGEVGYVFDHGYHLTGKKAKVTKCSGRRIIELDGRPALDVYAEWVGKPKAEVAGGVILVFSVNYPILLHREGYTLSVHPVGGNEDGSIDTGHAMEVGYVLELGEATTDALIDEVAVAVRAAAMKVKKPQAVLLSHCGGRAIALGDRVKEAAGKVKEAIGEVPWVGYLAFGEQGTPRPGEKEHANLSLSVLVLGE